MSTSLIERKFSFVQTIVFKCIGNKLPTNSLKGVMDIVFVVFEKVGCKFDAFSSLYLKLYQDIVTKEIAMARISKGDRVLIIGSGSLPATPALIAQNTEATVVSIDRDKKSVKDATQYVKNHHLEHRLIIEHADGLHYPVELFDVIFILYGVKQQKIMLEYLADHIRENTRVLLRAITDAQGNIMDRTIDVSQHFLVKERVRTDTLGSFESFLLEKKLSR